MWASEPYHIVLMGDPHLPGRRIEAKEAVVDRINSWENVDLVAILGDICHSTGTRLEYVKASRFFRRLKKPFLLINGNHDYVFADTLGLERPHELGSAESRKNKLKLFKQTFGMDFLFYSRSVGNYHLIFLSLDSLTSPYYAQLSKEQLNWFRDELDDHKDKPTIVFCHSPL